MPALNENQLASRNTNSYLLSGLLKCGQCGSNMIVQTRKVKGTTYRYYACSNYHKNGRSACSQQNLKADRYENDVIIKVKDKISLILMTRTEESNSITEHEIKTIHQEIAKIDQQLDGLNQDTLELFETRKTYNTAQYIYLNEQLKQRIDQLSTKREALIEKSKGQNNCQMREFMAEFIQLPRQDMYVLKDAFKILIKEITITDDDINIDYNFKG